MVGVAQLCPNGGTSFVSNTSGNTYQWEVNSGAGFANISNNSNYLGANTKTLQLSNIPVAWNGYKYRCLVDGNAGTDFTISFLHTWNGTVNNQ